jgi:CRP/FNR family cyclic AMP-dependent transcriptional regulator
MLQELAECLASGWARQFRAPNPLTSSFTEPWLDCVDVRDAAAPLAMIVRAAARNDILSLEASALQWGTGLTRSGATSEEVARTIWLAVGSLQDHVPAGPLREMFSRLRHYILFTAALATHERSEGGMGRLGERAPRGQNGGWDDISGEASDTGPGSKRHTQDFSTPTLMELLTPLPLSASTVLDPLLHEVILGARMFRLATYRQGQLIFSPNTTSRQFYLVIHGPVRLFELLRDGRSVTLTLLGHGDVLGILSRDFFSFHATHAESFRTSCHMVLPEAEFLRLLPSAPILSLQALQSLQRQLADIRQLVASLLSRDVAIRLAHILLRLIQHFGEPAGEGMVRLATHLTHQELADMIGSNRVTVTKKLQDMERRGLIRRHSHNQMVVHRPSLEQMLS